MTLAVTTILLAASAPSLFAQARSNIQITATVVAAVPVRQAVPALAREAIESLETAVGVRETPDGLATVRTEVAPAPGAADRRRARITVAYSAN